MAFGITSRVNSNTNTESGTWEIEGREINVLVHPTPPVFMQIAYDEGLFQIIDPHSLYGFLRTYEPNFIAFYSEVDCIWMAIVFEDVEIDEKHYFTITLSRYREFQSLYMMPFDNDKEVNWKQEGF